MDTVTPAPGDLCIERNGHSTLFISLVQRDLSRAWKATSSSLLEVRGVSRFKQPGDYQAAPDFTSGRVFNKGQASHLLQRYLPELLTGRPRILLRRQFGWELDVPRPALKPGKARKPCRARF